MGHAQHLERSRLGQRPGWGACPFPGGWLTYLTLAIASGVLIGTSTGLVYNLLGGEVTARFLLKVLTTGSISSTAFIYYLTDLRRDEKEVGG